MQIIQGKILAVDKVRHTVTVQGEGNQEYTGIQTMPRTLGADGTGSFQSPEVNQIVFLCTPSSATTPFILGYSSLPLNPDDENADPNDYRLNRPVLNDGDDMISSRDAGYVIMRKGGMVEVAASAMARTFWVPIENLIHSICENFLVETPGATLSMLARDEDETWGADRTPMEFQLGIKEFCDDLHDIFDLRIGRVAAEDDTYIPIAGATGQIVMRLVINRHYVLNIDKDGNSLRTLQGSDIENIEGSKFSTVQKTFRQVVQGLMTHDGKDRSVNLMGYDSLKVGSNRDVDITGTLTTKIGGAENRTVTGRVTEVTGEYVRRVQGAIEEQNAGPSNEYVGGTKTLGAAENLQLVAGGKFSLTVGNAQYPVEGNGIEIVLAKGDTHLVNQLGRLVIAAGGTASAAVARILVKPSGAIVLQNALGATAQVEINATGISIRTPGGAIVLDTKGSVSLGPIGGGAVVTTLTHPIDYITGLPILGSSSVSAGGIPSPIAIPPIFIPDMS